MWCGFESPEARSPRLGIGVHILEPGETPGFYHLESEQEGFLVLSGECVAIVEGEERRLRAWDYLHCPPGRAHGGAARRRGRQGDRLAERGLRGSTADRPGALAVAA
jgi:uncharacterized cupin superfamily protein